MEGVLGPAVEDASGGRGHDVQDIGDGQASSQGAYQIKATGETKKVDAHPTSKDSARRSTGARSTGSRLESRSPRKSVQFAFSRGSDASSSSPPTGACEEQDGGNPQRDPVTPSPGLRPLIGLARRSLSAISVGSGGRQSRRSSGDVSAASAAEGFAKKKARSFLEPDSSTAELDPGLRRGLTATSIVQSDVSSSVAGSSGRSGRAFCCPAWIKINRMRLWLFLEEPFVDWKSSALSSV
ncbi:unnamed protein product, partial [Prorocentrum cordatum]